MQFFHVMVSLNAIVTFHGLHKQFLSLCSKAFLHSGDYSKHKVKVQWFIVSCLQKTDKNISWPWSHDDQAYTWRNSIYWFGFRARVKATTRYKIFPNDRNLHLGNSNSKQLYVCECTYLHCFTPLQNLQYSKLCSRCIWFREEHTHPSCAWQHTWNYCSLMHKFHTQNPTHATAEITCTFCSSKRLPLEIKKQLTQAFMHKVWQTTTRCLLRQCAYK